MLPGQDPYPTRSWGSVASVEAVFQRPSLRLTLWKTNMDPENRWLVEENTLPGGQDVRVNTVFGSVVRGDRQCLSSWGVLHRPGDPCDRRAA